MIVVVPTPKKVKISPKIVDCIFISYKHNSSAYQFLVYKFEILNIHINMIIEAMNASFFKHVFLCKSNDGASSSKRIYEIMNEDDQDQDQQNVEDEPKRNKRLRVKNLLV